MLSKGRDDETVRQGMGVLAARFIEDVVTEGAILGVSYGRSLASTIAALSPKCRFRKKTILLIVIANPARRGTKQSPETGVPPVVIPAQAGIQTGPRIGVRGDDYPARCRSHCQYCFRSFSEISLLAMTQDRRFPA